MLSARRCALPDPTLAAKHPQNPFQVTGLRPTAWSQYDPEWHKRKAFPFPIVEGTSAEAYYGSQWMVRLWLSRHVTAAFMFLFFSK